MRWVADENFNNDILLTECSLENEWEGQVRLGV
jgi:hypothetical protein